MHVYLVSDETGDTVDAVSLCSDSCHREYAGDDYAGWYGCHETEHTDYCANCGVVIPGMDACECQFANVIVNRFLSENGERCKHGRYLQLPAANLVREGR
jgi:hypothetical protein